MLCNRLVCGIQDQRIQQRLLAEVKLEFKQAFELAQAMNSANHDRQDDLLPKVTTHVIGVKENTLPKAVILRMLSVETAKRKATLLVHA